jgi:3-deoxy-D-manno-octulosonic-acid transferase
MRFLLDLLYMLLAVAASPWLVWRLIDSGEWRHVGARLAPRLGDRLSDSIWLHGASVGEVNLLRPMVIGLEREYPDLPLVISAVTATGVAAARSAWPQHRVVMLPFDLSFLMRRALKRFAPRLLVIVESEFWPNLLLAAEARSVPVAVVNARVSPRSARFYRRSRIIPARLRQVAVIGTQNAGFRERFVSLGVAADRVFVTGNMKYDLAPSVAAAGADQLRAALGYAADDVVIIGGSLHEGEDEALLAAFDHVSASVTTAALIIVPRYPVTARSIEARVRERGRTAVLKSAIDAQRSAVPGRGAVLIVDTLGELGRLYAVADIAFVGGSLFYRGSNKGGHNLMEPAVVGVPVLFGPWNFSFRDTVADLLAADAAVMVRDANELATAIASLATDSAARSALGARARGVVLAGRGATERNLVLLRALLTAPGERLPASGFDSTMPRATGSADGG